EIAESEFSATAGRALPWQAGNGNLFRAGAWADEPAARPNDRLRHTRVALVALLTLDAGVTLRPRCTGVTLRPRSARISLWALRPGRKLAGLEVRGNERPVLHLQTGDGVVLELAHSNGVLGHDEPGRRLAQRGRSEDSDDEGRHGDDRVEFRLEHFATPVL